MTQAQSYVINNCQVIPQVMTGKRYNLILAPKILSFNILDVTISISILGKSQVEVSGHTYLKKYYIEFFKEI